MIICDALTGIRRSELMGLQWHDLDFLGRRINIVRSVVDQAIGKCKTEASRKPVVMDEYIAQALIAWRQESTYTAPADWVWASTQMAGKQPLGSPPSCGTTSSRRHVASASTRKSAGILFGTRSRPLSSHWAWMRKLCRNSCGMPPSRRRWTAIRRRSNNQNARRKSNWRI